MFHLKVHRLIVSLSEQNVKIFGIMKKAINMNEISKNEYHLRIKYNSFIYNKQN